MTSMNVGRLILGGLVAGLLMNVGEAVVHGGVLNADGVALIARYQLPNQSSPAALVSLIAMTFGLGIAAVWLYAAIRPRYGAGPRTAGIAGTAVWFLAHAWAGVYIGMGFMGLVPPKLAFVPNVTGLPEAIIATLAGAWCYREP